MGRFVRPPRVREVEGVDPLGAVDAADARVLAGVVEGVEVEPRAVVGDEAVGVFTDGREPSVDRRGRLCSGCVVGRVGVGKAVSVGELDPGDHARVGADPCGVAAEAHRSHLPHGTLHVGGSRDEPRDGLEVECDCPERHSPVAWSGARPGRHLCLWVVHREASGGLDDRRASGCEDLPELGLREPGPAASHLGEELGAAQARRLRLQHLEEGADTWGQAGWPLSRVLRHPRTPKRHP